MQWVNEVLTHIAQTMHYSLIGGFAGCLETNDI